MQETTLVNIEMPKNLSFVANYSPQGVKMVIIVPKIYHKDIQKFKNPIKVVVEDMAKKLTFIGNYGQQGVKMVIIIPKIYHKDIQKFKKPINVIVADADLGMATISSAGG